MKTFTTSLWRWLLIFVTAVAISTTFTACGDDDDDKAPKEEQTETGDDVNTSKSELVGKWESEEGAYSYGYKLDSNGKGYSFEASPNGEVDRWSIKWTYKNKRLVITDEDGDKEVLCISYIDEDIMIFSWEDEDDDVDTLYKVSRFSWE